MKKGEAVICQIFIMYNSKKRGQSAIEWGVLLPLLILIISSVLEMGPLMNTVMVVDKATEYSARMAAVKGTPNEEVVFSYIQNMQGMLELEDFLEQHYSASSGKNELEFIDEYDPTIYRFTPSDSETEIVDGRPETTVTPSRLSVNTVPDEEKNNLITDHIEIIPGEVYDRFSSSWVMVGAKHQYKILTPVLQAVLSGKCETGTKGSFLDFCEYFPISKTAVFRVE